MGFTVVPDKAHAHLIHVTAEGHWTWNDFLAMNQEISELIAVRGESDVIVDFTLSHHVPVGLSDNAAQISENFNPSVRSMVFVGASGEQRIAIEMYRKFFPEEGQRFLLVETMEEAYQHLNLIPSR